MSDKPLLPVVWAIGEGQRRRYTATERLILIILANHMNGVRECWPSVTALAVECAVSERHIRRALARFRADGLIAIELGTGRGYTSLYRLMAKAGQPDLFPTDAYQNMRKGGQGVPLSTKRRTLSHPLQGQKADSDDIKRRTPSPGESTKKNPPRVRTSCGALSRAINPTPEENDPRKELWTKGPDRLRHLTGQLNGQAKNQIGKFLKLANGDCPAVLSALEACELERPFEPIPWIVRAIQARSSPKTAAPDQLAEQWGLASFVTPVLE